MAHFYPGISEWSRKLSKRSWSFLTLIVTSLSVGAVNAQPLVPNNELPAWPPSGAALRFEDFPAQGNAPERNAPLVLTARARAYRTRLGAAAVERPNFAGHYILATWGCGTECLMGAAINSRTGRVTFLPFATCCISAAPDGAGDMVTFSRDSSLIRLIGQRDEREAAVGAHYYRIVADRFEHLRFITLPAQR